jgi:amino acid transporter/nucleotide-binding universal stress UspA family protein
MLYGDWGTSRFYVLGLAFYYALFSSFWYILGVGILVAAVGWAYTVVCRVYPDGGGVYSAARQISPLLSVIGALLLFADYAVTAALSAFDGIKYIGLENDTWVKVAAIGSIVVLGIINYIGPKRAGAFALVVAMATLVLTAVMVVFAVPYLPQGWHHVQAPHGSLHHQWVTLANVVLALSGVEAIANMTGIMVLPVAKTAKKSIWPVLLEVVLLNLLFGVAMLALPAVLHAKHGAEPREFQHPASQYQANDAILARYRETNPSFASTAKGLAAYEKYAAEHSPHSSKFESEIKDRVLRVMGEQYVGRWFGVICGIVFGLLLISAVNTVVGGMLSVCYVMARDHELPHFFNRLNLFGVPWIGLIPALVVPILLLLIFPTLETLADLYAIGVVGAIAINLSCCTVNRKLPVHVVERVFIGLIAAVMIAIELTLAVQKLHALIFVGIILAVGLGARFFTKSYLPARAKRIKELEEAAKEAIAGAMPTAGAPESVFGTPAAELDMSRPHVMVATRGGQRLLDFAASYAKQINGILFVLYVRQLNVQFAPVEQGPTLEEDAEARNVFRSAWEACKKQGVPMIPIYVVSRDVSYAILDFAATYDVRALLMGVSRQGTLLRALRGDVLTSVADQLPQDIPLLIHA